MPPPSSAVEPIRAASRRLVRELGFMGGAFAGTDLPPSAVHALIEIEAQDVISARDLGGRLRLEKSSVSRMLRKLVLAGEVREAPGEDARAKKLSLSPAGRARVAAVHAFARGQVAGALARLPVERHGTVLEGLSLYADALAASPRAAAPVEIVEGYRPGLLARITEMHALYYAREAGFGRRFEAVVAGGLAEFWPRLDSPANGLWTGLDGERTVGAIAIDGEHLGEGVAHLRWFIVDDGARGSGLGRRLLRTALDFVDARGFAETHLWTFAGLHAARRLYESHGFALAEERPGDQWGRQVLEQRFVRPRA